MSCTSECMLSDCGCVFRSRGEKESGVAAMEVQSRVGKNVVEDPRDLPPVILMDED